MTADDDNEPLDLAVWAAGLDDQKLAETFAANLLFTAMARASQNPKTRVFIDIHEAILGEMKRRGLKAKGQLD